MRTILVVANETIGGATLFEAVKAKVDAADGDARVVCCVPRGTPRHGNLIYDDFVFQAAQARVDLARQFLREAGIEAVGEVGDPDPFSATMDAIGEYEPDEIIVSTFPATSSGWMRRDLIDRISDATRLPVEHVVVDLDSGRLPFKVTLVVTNRTAASATLLECLKELNSEDDSPRFFIAVVPQEGSDGMAGRRAAARLAQIEDRMRSSGLISAGLIGDPDPYTAVMNALQFFRVDDIVVATLPATRSGWLRGDLIRRVRSATGKPVRHIVVEASAGAPTAV